MVSEIVYEMLATVTMATTNPIPIHFPEYTKGESTKLKLFTDYTHG